MEQIFNPSALDILIKLSIAMLFGMVIGAERIIAHKTAGMRTYALVSMGAALFVMVGDMSVTLYSGLSAYTPGVITAAVISGIGFLGTGLMIWKDKTHLSGLTTATGLWISAGIGVAVGFGFYSVGLIATILTLFIFVVLWFVEQQIKRIPSFPERYNGEDQINDHIENA